MRLTGNLSRVGYEAFNSTNSSSSIYENAYLDSSFNITSSAHTLFDSGVSSIDGCMIVLSIIVSISGNLAPNLDPSGMTLLVNASGPPSMDHLTYDRLLSGKTSDVNISQKRVLAFNGYGNSSTSFQFLNEHPVSIIGSYPHSFYEFIFKTEFLVTIGSYIGTHYFGVLASLTGLRQASSVGFIVNLTDTGMR